MDLCFYWQVPDTQVCILSLGFYEKPACPFWENSNDFKAVVNRSLSLKILTSEVFVSNVFIKMCAKSAKAIAPEICEMRDGYLDSSRDSQRGRVSRLSLSEFVMGMSVMCDV
jgi:hypothetical protein